MYNTKQREAVLAYLASLDGEHVTAGRIAAHFRGRVGRTTVYRLLEKLTRLGDVRKYTVDGASGACYQYTGCGGEPHFHLKCESCGRLRHMRCQTLDALRRHVLDEHSFRLDPSKTVFMGRCESCGKAT